MGKRLTKITTKTGDDGTTGLANGSRVLKSHIRIEVLGDLDELNSAIGLTELDTAWQVRVAQDRIFDIGAAISNPDRVDDPIDANDVRILEEGIEYYTEQMPPLREFILPGGGQQAASLHLARAICRRAERHLIALAETEHVSHNSIVFLNRLSDYLFQLARWCTVRGAKVMETEGKTIDDLIGRCPPLNLITYPEFCAWTFAVMIPELHVAVAHVHNGSMNILDRRTQASSS